MSHSAGATDEQGRNAPNGYETFERNLRARRSY